MYIEEPKPTKMDFPIVGIAYRATKQGDAITIRKILKTEIDRINFVNSIGDPKTKIRYEELTEEEKYHLDPLSFVNDPIRNPATKKKKRLAAITQKTWLWIASHITQLIIAIAATIIAAYLIYKFKIPH